MMDLDRVEPLDESRLPNLANVAPLVSQHESWARGAGNKLYMSPLVLFWIYTIWNKQLTTAPKTFSDLLKPELKGKIGVLDDEVPLFILAGFPATSPRR